MIMLNERQRNRKSDDPDGNEPNVIFRPEGRLATSTGRALELSRWRGGRTLVREAKGKSR